MYARWTNNHRLKGTETGWDDGDLGWILKKILVGGLKKNELEGKSETRIGRGEGVKGGEGVEPPPE